MIYGSLPGLSKGLPRVVFGTLPLARADAATFSLLDGVVELGCCAFDTASAYGDGASERVIGAWMTRRGNRREIVVIDKGAHPVEGRSRVDPGSIRADLRQSLHRLETDYIDVYLLHRDDPAVPVGPIVEALNELQSDGTVILFGASNWSWTRLEEAHEYARARGLSSFSVSSNQYSLAIQHDVPFPGTLSINRYSGDPEWEWYKKTQFPLLSWSSLARGLFSGKFTRNNLTDFTDPQSRISIRCYARDDNFTRLERARMLAEEKGVTVAQIALAYILHQPLNCYTITGSLHADHFRDSVDALDLVLSDGELAWLNLRADTRNQRLHPDPSPAERPPS